ncbi:MAG: YgiQ family radical SAM protein [Clostridia bacterium]|nr:YgiQ family radical SAM protein [Clostridia bacterium]
MINSPVKQGFLPLCYDDMLECGWDRPDFVYVTGDAYVDHPSFGTAIISRVLESAGFRVAILSQPDYKSAEAFKEYPKPRLGFLVSAGNIDSMVAHYTVSKKKRSYDYYSPGGVMGKRPDRAVIVYCNRIREAYGDVPIIIGGLEASLRRHAHYDYWDNRVRRSILVDSRADILAYGMGENIILRIAQLLEKGVPIKKIRDVRGTVCLMKRGEKVHFDIAGEFDYNELKSSKELYAKAFGVQYKNTDPVSGKAVIEYYDDKMLVANPPMPPLEREELDKVYALPYTRRVHPSYEPLGGVPGIDEVKFSITHTRGCFGACNFCAIAYHQGRTVRSRSIDSVVSEAKAITEMPDFKGYIHDVGGPTANFRYQSCEKQLESGVCSSRKCLAPTPCKNLVVDHSEYIKLLEKIESLDRVKKVFIRSGIRFDYVMYDKNEEFFKRLVKHHVSGQLKVAPEHCSANVLSSMGKPDISVYESFRKRFFELTKSFDLEQYLVPYLMSSHPGSRLEDAVELALYLKSLGMKPEQVQDFYPTPGTASTVMYYTGTDPLTGKKVYVANDYEQKRMQRALLQYTKPENAELVRKALVKCHREELIGYSAECLVRPARGEKKEDFKSVRAGRSGEKRAHTPPRTQKKGSCRYKGKATSGKQRSRGRG